MAENIVELLTDVADAIREKKGATEKINAQAFAEEIKNLPSGSSPFAVDFGEEIATGNLTFINALQEDIDYYNEVQRKRAAGEVTDAQLLASEEFKEKIAWWPKGMTETRLKGFLNLKCVEFTSVQNAPLNCPRLQKYKGVVQSRALDLSSLGFCAIDNVSTFPEDSETALILDGDSVTNGNNGFLALPLRRGRFRFPNLTSAQSFCGGHTALREIYIDIPKVTSLSSFLRGGSAKKVHAVIKAVRSISACFDILYDVTELHIEGLAASLSISNNSLVTSESVKFILQHCQAREDGASYTLTLNAAVKTAFLAKCDEDAEYAASLASATEKGLTLA